MPSMFVFYEVVYLIVNIDLSKKLMMPANEVYKLLSSLKDNYFDLESREWCARETASTIRIKQFDSKTSIPSSDNFALFCKCVISMPWEELRDFLESPIFAKKVTLAAFLVNISEKRCIRLNKETLSLIEISACRDPVMPLSYCFEDNFNAAYILENCDAAIETRLHAIFKETHFIDLCKIQQS
jgi:hypothetical protein